MVPTNDMGSLALYLEKQREARRLSEELDRLKSNEIVGSAMRIKHELEALMADYELTPEQMLEALCMLFDLAKPVGFVSPSESGLDDVVGASKGAADNGTQSAPAAPVTTPSKTTSPSSSKSKKSKRSPKVAGPKAAAAVAGSEQEGVTGGLRRAKTVKILTREERLEQAAQQRAAKQDKKPGKPATKAAGSSGQAQGKSEARRRKREVKIYTNPHTGQQVRTRGANHRILNQWRSEYGAETVNGWWAYEQ